MTARSEFAPLWTKVIARAWVDPDFKSQLENDPAAVLSSYGITNVGGKDLSALSGRISVVDAPKSDNQRPRMDGDQLVIPLPAAPRSYDNVVDPDEVSVAGAGTATSAFIEQQEMMAQPNGLQVGSSWQTPGGQTKTTHMGQSSSTQNQSHSIPSVPSLDDDDDDDDDDGAGGEAGGDAGADAGEVAGDVAVDAGGDAAADAAAAAAALCA